MPLALALTELQARAIVLLLIGFLGLGLLAFLLYRRHARNTAPDREMTALEHLEELRTRVVRIGILLVAWIMVFMSIRIEPTPIGRYVLPAPVPSLYDTISARVFAWLVATTVPADVQVVTLSPTEAVSAQIQIAFVLAVIITFPFLLYETWAFFAPGLAPDEQRTLRRTLPVAILLFAAGAFFGFRLVVPILFDVLYGFADPLGAQPLLSAGTFVGTVTTLVLLFGFAFELPLVMAALVRLRILRPQSYVRKWRHATIAIFIVAALASDPTLTSQLIIGTFLLVLYWSGVLLAFLVQPPPLDAGATPAPARLL